MSFDVQVHFYLPWYIKEAAIYFSKKKAYSVAAEISKEGKSWSACAHRTHVSQLLCG